MRELEEDQRKIDRTTDQTVALIHFRWLEVVVVEDAAVVAAIEAAMLQSLPMDPSRFHAYCCR